MKKLTLAFLALMLMLGAGNILAATDTVIPKKTVKRVDTSCIIKSVQIRENTILASYAKMSKAVNTALVQRQNDLTIAWNMLDTKKRQTAINSAWKKYNATRKTAVKTYRDELTKAWKTFRDEAKKCKVNNKVIDPNIEANNGEKSDKALE